MERSEHSLVPQWLKSGGVVSSGGSSNNQLKSSYSDICSSATRHSEFNLHNVIFFLPKALKRFRRSFSSINSGYSRSYNSSSRSWYSRDCDNDTENFFDKGKLVLGEGKHHHHSGSLKNTLTNRFEKDLFQHSQSMGSGRSGETWSNRTAGDLSNGKSDAMVARGGIGNMHKTVFEEEFPLLGPEAKQGSSETVRVMSSGSAPATHSLLTCPPAAIASNGLTSTLHVIPVTIGTTSAAAMSHQYNDSASFSSMASSITGLNMAGALSQGTPRSQILPRSFVDAQKLEELAIKQSRLLIPITPSMPRGLVVSPSEKSKVKTGQQQQHHLFFSSRPANHSPRGGPAKSDGPKTTSDSSRVVSSLQELNGLSLAEKDSLSPSGSRIVLSVANASTSSHGLLQKRATSQAKSRSEFFKSLSNKSSSRNPSSDPCPSGMPCASESSEVITGNAIVSLTHQFGEASLVATSAENSLTESSCTITDSGNACGEPSKFSSNEMQHLSTKSILHLDEEETAFLLSLGWKESAGEDEGLTEEEIRDFCEKYMKFQPSSNVLHKVHQRIIALPFDSNCGSCGGAPLELS